MKSKLKKLIKEYKADIKKYHLKRVNEEYSSNLENGKLENVDDLIDFADNWEFSSDMDLAYLMGKITVAENLLYDLEKK